MTGSGSDSPDPPPSGEEREYGTTPLSRRSRPASRQYSPAGVLTFGNHSLHLMPWTSSTPAPRMPSWRQHRDGWRETRLANFSSCMRRPRPARYLGGWKGPRPAR
ncbi:unnamed protein product [Laminaria digitata]